MNLSFEDGLGLSHSASALANTASSLAFSLEHSASALTNTASSLAFKASSLAYSATFLAPSNSISFFFRSAICSLAICNYASASSKHIV